MFLRRSVAVLILCPLLAHCGSGGDAAPEAGPPAAGVFEGGTGAGLAPIAGLQYRSAEVAGTTDAEGRFEYRPGRPLRLSIGDVLLGESEGGAVVTPYALAGGCAYPPPLRRLARFLYSLDTDGDAGNGLQLPDVAASAEPLPIASLSDAELETRVRAWRGTADGLADERSAVDAFVAALDGEAWTQDSMAYFGVQTLLRSQGLAHDGQSWFFSWRYGLQRTDAQYRAEAGDLSAIPAVLREQGSNHIGDVDVLDGTLYVPIEDDAYARPLIALYDAQTLAYRGQAHALAPHQAHVAWVALDATRRVAYSGDWSQMDQINVYDLDHEFAWLRALPLGTTLDRIQGGEVYEGALYLTRDDADKSVYKINLDTGTVLPLLTLVPDASGALGEMEGVAMRRLDDGTAMHTIDLKASYLGANFRHFRRTQPPNRQRWCG